MGDLAREGGHGGRDPVLSRPPRRRVLFFRRFRAFRGAHLTAWNYFNHLRSADYEPFVHFSPDSVLGEGNPWSREPDRIVRTWRAEDFDAIVVGGRDWRNLQPSERATPAVPILHLVLHVRRADPGDDAFEYLRHPAIRVCPTEDIAARLRASGAVNGPIHVNPHGIDVDRLPVPRPDAERDVDVVIVGLKKPELAVRLGTRLRRPGRRVEALAQAVPRAHLLALLGRARVAVLLPNETEGFYRPSVEAMALRAVVVMPRFDGNSALCTNGAAASIPAYEEDAIVASTEEALALGAAHRAERLARAHALATARTLEDERRGFLAILDEETRAGRWPSAEARAARYQ